MNDTRGRGGRRGSRDYEDDDLDAPEPEADEFDEEEPEERPRRSAPAARGRATRGAAPARPAKKTGWSLFGSPKPARKAPARGGRIDFGSMEEDEEAVPPRRGGASRPRLDEDAEYEDRESRAPRRRAAGARAGRREKMTLMDLATPVFGYAAILPQDGAGIHPGYQQFRDSVLAALQRMDSEAAEHGIDPEDARDARYALSLFLDEQVADSEWSGRMQWASEPLSLVVANDPEGGVNFFVRLDAFGERRKAVKEIYLVCLALGFRGRYIELDPTQQAARLGEIRQKVVRSIHPAPLDTREVLFPEAYTPAIPLAQEAPPPPRWWMMASLGIVAFCVILYVVLFWSAGTASEPASAVLRQVAGGSR